MFPVVYQDDYYVAVHKPHGLLVHRSRLSQDRIFLLQELRNQLDQHVYPVHRLDRATSGVIIFGLSSDAAKQLNQLFTDHEVEKTYHAIVRGWMPQHEVTVDHAIADPESNTPEQQAITRFHELARCELPFAVDKYLQARYSLVEAIPLTGRRHQIRKHLKHISHPIIGDVRYGKGTHNRFFIEQFACHRLLLVARQLRFTHPYTLKPITIEAQEDEQWQTLLADTGLETA